MQGNLFWELGALSDEALLRGLNRVVVSGRRVLAELLAHLCEVENRRLHLDSGYPSMFAYCTGRLGLSEDEAYRRIEVARLARRAPMVFQLIAEGRLSLSAATLLKPHVLAPNLAELVQVVTDKSVQAARQALAALFPRPDVPDSLRKLPEPKPAIRPAPARSLFELEATRAPDEVTISHSNIARDVDSTPALQRTIIEKNVEPTPSAPLRAPTAAPPATASRVPAPEPLAPGRYKISFTASGALKEKLELARDLMRHSVPGGDLATILGRALDLLVADLMKSRFGAGARAKRSRRSNHVSQRKPTPSEHVKHSEPTSQPAPLVTDQPPTSETVPRAMRLALLERDGLRCTWRGPDGKRCTARAWLERDHKHPRSLGGATTLQNLRHLCRAHNRRAAEHIHGEHHIDRAIRENRARHLQKRGGHTP